MSLVEKLVAAVFLWTTVSLVVLFALDDRRARRESSERTRRAIAVTRLYGEKTGDVQPAPQNEPRKAA